MMLAQKMKKKAKRSRSRSPLDSTRKSRRMTRKPQVFDMSLDNAEGYMGGGGWAAKTVRGGSGQRVNKTSAKVTLLIHSSFF